MRKRINGQDNLFSEGDIVRVKKCFFKNPFQKILPVGTIVRVTGDRSFIHSKYIGIEYRHDGHYGMIFYPERYLQKSRKHKKLPYKLTPSN